MLTHSHTHTHTCMHVRTHAHTHTQLRISSSIYHMKDEQQQIDLLCSLTFHEISFFITSHFIQQFSCSPLCIRGFCALSANDMAPRTCSWFPILQISLFEHLLLVQCWQDYMDMQTLLEHVYGNAQHTCIKPSLVYLRRTQSLLIVLIAVSVVD